MNVLKIHNNIIKIKIQREIQTGKKFSKESCQKISISKIGKPRSLETKIKLSNILSGRKIPKDTLEKRIKSQTGLKRSKEFCDKMRKNRTGKNNPMFGKIKENSPRFGLKHSKNTIILISKNRKGKCLKENNGMFGKSIYDVWIEKYGKEEADKKQSQMIQKRKNTNKNKLLINENS